MFHHSVSNNVRAVTIFIAILLAITVVAVLKAIQKYIAS